MVMRSKDKVEYRGQQVATAWQLIRELSTLPPDLPVVVLRSGSNREMAAVSVLRRDVGMRAPVENPCAIIFTEWLEKQS